MEVQAQGTFQRKTPEGSLEYILIPLSLLALDSSCSFSPEFIRPHREVCATVAPCFLPDLPVILKRSGVPFLSLSSGKNNRSFHLDGPPEGREAGIRGSKAGRMLLSVRWGPYTSERGSLSQRDSQACSSYMDYSHVGS